jgi:hypothetical protein
LSQRGRLLGEIPHWGRADERRKSLRSAWLLLNDLGIKFTRYSPGPMGPLPDYEVIMVHGTCHGKTLIVTIGPDDVPARLGLIVVLGVKKSFLPRITYHL